MKDTLLYFSDGTANSDDDAFVAKASDFISMAIGSSTTVVLTFRAGTGAAGVDTATLTLNSLAAGVGTQGFRSACKVVAGLLNGSKDKMYIVADEANSIFTAPFHTTCVAAMA
tara:strand:- start:450 stop:788 length:339 start_codon:yes stop_codon:yes gene_type:complete